MIQPIRFMVLALGLLTGGASLAQACSWFDPLPGWNTILDKKERNRITLHGVLVKKESGSACEAPFLLLSFKVEKAFGITVLKGDTVTIATPASSAACGVDFPLGAVAVVFADTQSSCSQPSDRLWTFLMSGDIPDPSPSQLDSLYGIPHALATRSAESRSKASPPAHSGWRGAGGMTFPLRTGFASDQCSADGRVLAK